MYGYHAKKQQPNLTRCKIPNIFAKLYGGFSLDRRQKKTRDAVFQAFSKLLEKKRYENITVQEIIDEANIGRSTFYAHFETKDELLRSMCTDIFHHVFTEELPQEADHDYSAGSKSLELKLGHILYHLKENQVNICGIIATDGDGLFMAYFKQYLTQLFSRYTMLFPQEVPEDFLIHHLAGSFAETVRWWVNENMKTSPEQTAIYFMEMTETH